MTVLSTMRDLPHARVWALAWPMMVANISVPLVGLVDTAMLGHFSDTTHLAAVALGAMVMSAVLWLLSFLRLSTTSTVGRALGAGEPAQAATHVQRALMLAGVLAVAVVAVQWVAVPAAMSVLAPDAAIASLGSTYAHIRMHGMPAVLATLVITGYFIGSEDTRRPLMIAVGVNVVNLVLDVLFVGAWGWGSAGAAWASFAAEWTGLALALWLWWRFLDGAQRERLRQWRRQGLRRGWGALLTMNSHLFVRTALLYAVLLTMTAAGGRISAEVLAANAILIQFTLVASYGLDGYAHAAESLAARTVGARDLRAFHRAVAAAAVPGAAIALGFGLLYLVAQRPLVALMTSIPEVGEVAVQHMGWVALVPVVSVAAYLLDGVFIGAGQTRLMMIWMMVSVGAGFVPLLAAGVLGGNFTNHHLWLAFVVFNTMRGATLAVAYRRLSVTGGWT